MLLTSLEQSNHLLITTVFILGLLVGSFLNVVIYRLPKMMDATWRKQCQEFLALPVDSNKNNYNLFLPRSHCQSCRTQIKAKHNIPVFSFLFLSGKCAYCQSTISVRYPLIELATGISSALIAWRFGYSSAMLFALILSWNLIVLSFIDIDKQLLPDDITLPTLWLGLVLNLFQVYTDSHDSIMGAVVGYMSLWSVFQLFKLCTGKEGMGYGDFKLLAMLGAWLGWQYLPLIITLSAFLGSCIGITLIILKKCAASQPIPFGPYLAFAGWIALIWGENINNWYLNHSGL